MFFLRFRQWLVKLLHEKAAWFGLLAEVAVLAAALWPRLAAYRFVRADYLGHFGLIIFLLASFAAWKKERDHIEGLLQANLTVSEPIELVSEHAGGTFILKIPLTYTGGSAESITVKAQGNFSGRVFTPAIERQIGYLGSGQNHFFTIDSWTRSDPRFSSLKASCAAGLQFICDMTFFYTSAANGCQYTKQEHLIYQADLDQVVVLSRDKPQIRKPRKDGFWRSKRSDFVTFMSSLD